MVAYIITGEGNISLVVKGEQFYVVKGADNYDAVVKALKEGVSEDEMYDVVYVEKAVSKFLDDTDIVVKDGAIVYQGEEIHNTLTERIFAFMKEGLPTLPLVNFLKKLTANPSFQAQKELFDFLEHKSLPITEDGDFLAYKAVGSDFLDKHSHTLDNSVGKVVSVPRSKVDDDREKGCSFGLHAGTLNYVFNQYGSFNNGADSDKCVIVKINPTDVVSVPTDCSCEKLRTCKYEVIKMYEGEMVKPLYDNCGGSYVHSDNDTEDYSDENTEEDYDPCEYCGRDTCDGCRIAGI